MNFDIGAPAIRHESAITVLEDMFILARQTPAYASVLYELLMTAAFDMEGKIRIIVNDEYEKEISKAVGVKSVKTVKDALVFFEESGYFTQPRTGIYYVSDFLLDGIMWRDANNIEVFIGKDESGARKISLVTKEAIPESHSSPAPTDKAGEGEHALPKKTPKTRKKRAKKEASSNEVVDAEVEADSKTCASDEVKHSVVESPSNLSDAIKPLKLNDTSAKKILSPIQPTENASGKSLQDVLSEIAAKNKVDSAPSPAQDVKTLYSFEQGYDGNDHDDMPPDEILDSGTMHSFEQEDEDEVNRPFWQDANGNLAPEYGDPCFCVWIFLEPY